MVSIHLCVATGDGSDNDNDLCFICFISNQMSVRNYA